VGPNPRIAAGSTVALYWLRLFRCPEVKKYHAELNNRLTTLDMGSHSNAPAQRRAATPPPTRVCTNNVGIATVPPVCCSVLLARPLA
jgi:hypothetical protein